jgi:hypothetical protein
MNTETVREDLAFMRALVAPDERWQRGFGETYAACGACYGVQMIMHGLQGFGVIPGEGLPALLVVTGPTVVFIALLTWISVRTGRPIGGGLTSRAVGSVFGAIGLANLVLMALIGSIAWREHNLKIWLVYPCVVLVMQGAAWLVAYMLRRKPWFGLVAAGWFAVGLGMGFAIENPGWFILITGAGFIAFMLAPGVVIMRQARAA